MNNTRVKIELNRKGVAELLHSNEMEKLVQKSTDAIYRAAIEEDDGYLTEIAQKPTRVIGAVWPNTPHAAFSNREHNTLEKALRRGKV